MKVRRRIAAPKAQGLCGPCYGLTQLQQAFTTAGMGSDRHFAQQHSSGPNVELGDPNRHRIRAVSRAANMLRLLRMGRWQAAKAIIRMFWNLYVGGRNLER
jgi:hypothetical protein